MDNLLAYTERHRGAIVALTREMVECESPSGDEAALRRMGDLVADRLSGDAKVKRIAGGRLLCEFRLPGRGKEGQILALGHIDTVWPVGTLAGMPFQERDGRVWGPGVLDMKSGIAFFVFAMRGLRELGIPVGRKVLLQLNADEETGSKTSRAFTEDLARNSAAVLVLEPGTGLEGKLKTARKGGGVYRLAVEGKAAHAGVDFTAGASAIVELARQISRVVEFTDLERGITVNPGVIAGGTRSNVIAAAAAAEVDVRVPKMKDAAALDRKFRALRPVDKRCSIQLSGGVNRPPMERSRGVVALFRAAERLGRELGVQLEESMTGGGSDGNFTAPLAPTLDGLGGVGEGAHAPHESILAARIADRTALLAKLVAWLGSRTEPIGYTSDSKPS
ncbi:MAG: M20 family metallopeptidase [Bryobacteraceae bacterium]|nr:M20 family metallopeptidase [Bryobacteraceae bacterium]